MTTNTTTNNTNPSVEITPRHVMAFTFGMVIPAIFATWDLPFVGIWVSGVVFCIYTFGNRQNSKAATFGAFISLITMVLILGGIEAKDALDKSVEIYPSYVMQ